MQDRFAKKDEGNKQDMLKNLATVLGQGMGGEASNLKAEAFQRRGEELMVISQYAEAVQSFKDASNWYFKAGDRKHSEEMKREARKARTHEIEETVERLTTVVGECHCVCEWVRVYDIFKDATIRTATARQAWAPRRKGELEFKAGDVINVIGKDEKETEADQDITWYRGTLAPIGHEARSRPATDGRSRQATPSNATRQSSLSNSLSINSGVRGTSGGRSRGVAGAPGGRQAALDRSKANDIPEEGLFPTRQLVRDERRRPVYADDGERVSTFVVVLNPSDLFAQYSAGFAASAPLASEHNSAAGSEVRKNAIVCLVSCVALNLCDASQMCSALASTAANSASIASEVCPSILSCTGCARILYLALAVYEGSLFRLLW